MSISFAPASRRDVSGAEACDLRVSSIDYRKGSKSRRSRSKAIDFRVHPEVASRWGVTSGDRVVGTVDEDGAWTLTKVKPNEIGYTVRTGGERGSSGRGKKCGGRKGYIYFRFSCTADQARVVMRDLKSIEYELLDIDGANAMFLPTVNVRRMVFQPAG